MKTRSSAKWGRKTADYLPAEIFRLSAFGVSSNSGNRLRNQERSSATLQGWYSAR